MGFWLFKTDPEAYSIVDLQKDRSTNWSGIRNFQARNYLQKTKTEDTVLIYHSSGEKAVVGQAMITKEGYPEIDSKDKREWVQVDLKFERTFETPVRLDEIKKDSRLREILLIKQSRLSVMPLTQKEFDAIQDLIQRKQMDLPILVTN